MKAFQQYLCVSNVLKITFAITDVKTGLSSVESLSFSCCYHRGIASVPITHLYQWVIFDDGSLTLSFLPEIVLYIVFKLGMRR